MNAFMHPLTFYSLKANPNVSVCAILRSHGAGAEVSSVVELQTAVRAGVSPADIIFLGPGKTAADLQCALDHGIGAVVCESTAEVELVAALAGDRTVSVLLRVNPAFETKGSGLAMGGKPRQFGIDENQIPEAISAIAMLSSIRVIGFHAYMGTRFLHAGDVVRNTKGTLTMATELSTRTGVSLDTVDIGGDRELHYSAPSPLTAKKSSRRIQV